MSWLVTLRPRHYRTTRRNASNSAQLRRRICPVVSASVSVRARIPKPGVRGSIPFRDAISSSDGRREELQFGAGRAASLAHRRNFRQDECAEIACESSGNLGWMFLRRLRNGGRGGLEAWLNQTAPRTSPAMAEAPRRRGRKGLHCFRPTGRLWPPASPRSAVQLRFNISAA